MNRVLSVMLVLAIVASAVARAEEKQNKVPVEHSKALERTGVLGTRAYPPTDDEKAATKDWTKEELKSGSPEIDKLDHEKGHRVAWFAIVRDVQEDKQKDQTRLLAEMKYFDGLTDLHLQVISIFGAGDFSVTIPGVGHDLKKLSLVRVYGKVAGEEKGVPQVAAEFVRSWDWGLFAFMPYGEDKSNPEWVKLRKVDTNNIYSSDPDDAYYEERLGKR